MRSASASCSRMRVRGSRSSKKWELRFIAAAPCSLSKKSLRDFSPSCFQNCKMKFCSIILQFCRCGGLLNAKGNPDGFLSHFSSLRNFRLDRFFDSLRPRCTRSGACVLWGGLQRRGRCEWKMDNWKWKAESARLTGLSLRGGRRPTWQSREGTAVPYRLPKKRTDRLRL